MSTNTKNPRGMMRAFFAQVAALLFPMPDHRSDWTRVPPGIKPQRPPREPTTDSDFAALAAAEAKRNRRGRIMTWQAACRAEGERQAARRATFGDRERCRVDQSREEFLEQYLFCRRLPTGELVLEEYLPEILFWAFMLLW